MSDAPEKQQAASTSAAEPQDTRAVAPGSPARSDKSSDSEGKNVREKLKDTQIDAQATSDPILGSDEAMKDAPNGTAKIGEPNASGSDTERGRLRRKRSHEDFEEDAEADGLLGKVLGKKVEGHKRKRSRDITKDIETFAPSKPVSPTIVEEDEQMTSPNRNTSTAATTDKASGADMSPKNKRTRDQIEKDAEATVEGSEAASANGKPVDKTGDERDTKRLRDKEGAQSAANAAESKTKIPSGSGFANTSAASPFAAMSAKPQASKPSDKTESLPQTSDEKFKSSVFGSFATAGSPFSGLANSKPSTDTGFGAATGGKLSTFAGSSAAPTTTGAGFGGTFGGLSKPGFGGSPFGGSTGKGFGGFSGSTTGGSFATSGSLEIKGLKSTNKDTPFGAAKVNEDSEEDGGEDDPEGETEKEDRQTSLSLLSQQPHETGEEGEDTIWTGRAKLYTMAGEGKSRGWKERGIGTFKFNITVDEPKRARFVLRAEGTHRLLLNAAVTRQMVFGGDAQGEKPKDGRLLFNSPNSDGELEMHLLKLKAENAEKLWEDVTKVQEEQL